MENDGTGAQIPLLASDYQRLGERCDGYVITPSCSLARRGCQAMVVLSALCSLIVAWSPWDSWWDTRVNYRRNKQTCRHADISEIYSSCHNCSAGGEHDPNQASVNEYKAGQGLGPHVDNKEHWDDRISILSLGDPVSMVFQRVDRRGHSTRDPPVRLLLEPNSLLILKGRARYEYTHCIPHCWEDIVNGVPSKRGRRVSVTLRHMSETTLSRL